MKTFLFVSVISLVMGFRGVYQVLYPIKKMVRFDENNHFISHEEIIFPRHPVYRQRFRVHNLTHHDVLLINVYNASDYILLSPKM